jgi:hypothetical protein
VHAGEETQKRRGKETEGKSKVDRGVGERNSGACGAQMRRSGLKAQAPKRRSQQWREGTVNMREAQMGRGEEGWTTRARIKKGSARRVVERERRC